MNSREKTELEVVRRPSRAHRGIASHVHAERGTEGGMSMNTVSSLSSTTSRRTWEDSPSLTQRRRRLAKQMHTIRPVAGGALDDLVIVGTDLFADEPQHAYVTYYPFLYLLHPILSNHIV
jgi:hypothetical protein